MRSRIASNDSRYCLAMRSDHAHSASFTQTCLIFVYSSIE
jgi:hypothetical protein